MSTNKALSNEAIDQLIIAAGGITLGDTKIEVVDVNAGGKIFHFFKVEEQIGSSVRDALTKAGKLDRLEKQSSSDWFQDAITDAKGFGVKVGDEIVGRVADAAGTVAGWLSSFAQKAKKG